MPRTVLPGRAYPLGAVPDERGVNFALFSQNAERVDLCLFSDDGAREVERIRVPEYTDQAWHCYLPGVAAGQLYAYRVYGTYAPERGHRFNHHKLLLDPYARQLHGRLEWHDANFGYRIGDPAEDLSFDTRDSARYVPKCQVVKSDFSWGDEKRPSVAWHDTILYEMHVRGFTLQHPRVPEGERGTFAGLRAPAVLEYVRALGVTALELLPVHAFIDDRHLDACGMRNYWGYSTLNFFALESRYLHGGDADDFRRFVQAAHHAGVEVVLDVVYNHTAEGNQLGPTLCYRGIDNAVYYRLMPEAPRYCADYTGTGNSLAVHDPTVLRMVMDSLRYWAGEMRVDGFRFDLASTLARGATHQFESCSSFFGAIAQDPALAHVKLIAEPWDVGEGGYRLGEFPPGFAEWNDRYRDTVRRFWRGDSGIVNELATRLTGSSDVFNRRGRRPWASVNAVTTHDGFTLHDLVSYDRKWNADNLHENGDGSDHNLSWNCGCEGPTDDAEVLALRARQTRNLLASLMLSHGTPQLLAGDELGRSQRGNNNAYCQDTELSWIDWQGLEGSGQDLLAFTRALIELRKDHVVFRRGHFLVGQLILGRLIPGTDSTDIVWLNGDGTPRTVSDWDAADESFIGFLLSGDAGKYGFTHAGDGEQDVTLLVAMNASNEAVQLWLPSCAAGKRWEVLIDTEHSSGLGNGAMLQYGEKRRIGPHCMALMACRPEAAASAP